MSIKEVTYFTVECDAGNCGKTLGDLGGDYSAWADEWMAVEEWTNHDGLVLTEDVDGKALCPDHAKDYLWCDQCGDKRTTDRDADDSPICPACAERVANE